jgi:hypothetical protein
VAWSASNIHWSECLQAELRRPVLQELEEWVAPERQLVACTAAVQQFQKLLDTHGGPAEAVRWARLKGRLSIHAQQSPAGPAGEQQQQQQQGGQQQQQQQQQEQGVQAAGSSGPCAADGAAAAALPVAPIPERIARLEKVTAQQRAVFGLGDALQVLTLTANGSAVRCAEQQGVNLEVVLHRAVWLAGR